MVLCAKILILAKHNSENPFEGTYNDVPISNISRTIEIDLKEMLREAKIPEPTQPSDGMLM